jgi:cell division protein FtsB
MQQTEKYWDLILKVLLGIILLMAIGGSLLAFIPKIGEMNKHKTTSEKLAQEINEVEAKAKALKEKQNRFKTDRIFVERIAHEIGYAHTNELIYQFPESPDETNAFRR